MELSEIKELVKLYKEKDSQKMALQIIYSLDDRDFDRVREVLHNIKIDELPRT